MGGVDEWMDGWWMDGRMVKGWTDGGWNGAVTSFLHYLVNWDNSYTPTID